MEFELLSYLSPLVSYLRKTIRSYEVIYLTLEVSVDLGPCKIASMMVFAIFWFMFCGSGVFIRGVVGSKSRWYHSGHRRDVRLRD